MKIAPSSSLLPPGRVATPNDVSSTLERRLRAECEGDVLFDAPARGRYATDASIYQIMPVGVLVPASERDVTAAIAIARDLKVPVEEVYESLKEIQKLESRPARNFSETDEKQIAITPDVYVVRDEEKWTVTDNDRGVQRLYINEALTKQLLKDPNAKEFIGEKLRNAQWLIRAIEQRRKTIIRVTECIVEKQRDFFEKGVSFLKPMILRDVAESVGMHESTISRVTTNKYVHTPQGLFELKYFFNSSIRRVSEEDIASESVKQAIKKIIDGEDKQNPLSDQAIVEILAKQDGIQIARRTVAKYREMLGILASSKRKKLF